MGCLRTDCASARSAKLWSTRTVCAKLPDNDGCTRWDSCTSGVCGHGICAPFRSPGPTSPPSNEAVQRKCCDDAWARGFDSCTKGCPACGCADGSSQCGCLDVEEMPSPTPTEQLSSAPSAA